MVSGVGGPEGPLFHQAQGTQGAKVGVEAKQLSQSISSLADSIRQCLHSPTSADNPQTLQGLADKIQQIEDMTRGG